MADSDRLEREIEEILGKIEHFPDAGHRRQRARNRWLQRIGTAISDRQRALMRELSRFTISQVMLLSILLIVGSLFFRRAAPLVMTWVLYGGIVLFVTTFAIMVFGSGRSSASREQKWRGRTVRMQSASRPRLSQRLRHWWATRTRR